MDTLSNDFHNQTIRVRDARKALRALEAYSWERTPAEAAMARRIRAALCGANDCTCGVVRGPQSWW